MSTQIFQTPVGQINIYDIIGNQNGGFLEDLLGLYRELFPEYISSLERVRTKAHLPENDDPRFVRHQWLVTISQSPAGLLSFKLVKQQRLALCLSIAIRPEYRKIAWGKYSRLSEFLIETMVLQIKKDAVRHGCAPPFGLVVEVESESATNDPQLGKMRHNLRQRYQEYGFMLLPIESHEPAFVRIEDSPGNAAAHNLESEGGIPMKLCVLPFFPEDQVLWSQVTMLNQVIDALLIEHYCLEENHWIVSQARRSVSKQGE